jgi:hypothetical protein
MTPNRKQVAEALKDEIQRLGGFVISPPGDIERIRFQFLIPGSSIQLQRLRDLGFNPIFRNADPRFGNDTIMPCNTFEIRLEPERLPVMDDRTIKDTELATKEKTDYERQQVLKYLGIQK